MFGSCFRTLAVILVSGSFVCCFVCVVVVFCCCCFGGYLCYISFSDETYSDLARRDYRVYSISRFVCACGILFFVCLFVVCLLLLFVLFFNETATKCARVQDLLTNANIAQFLSSWLSYKQKYLL